MCSHGSVATEAEQRSRSKGFESSLRKTRIIPHNFRRDLPRRLIEEHDWWVVYKLKCDRQPLPLPSRQAGGPRLTSRRQSEDVQNVVNLQANAARTFMASRTNRSNTGTAWFRPCGRLWQRNAWQPILPQFQTQLTCLSIQQCHFPQTWLFLLQAALTCSVIPQKLSL